MTNECDEGFSDPLNSAIRARNSVDIHDPASFGRLFFARSTLANLAMKRIGEACLLRRKDGPVHQTRIKRHEIALGAREKSLLPL